MRDGRALVVAIGVTALMPWLAVHGAETGMRQIAEASDRAEVSAAIREGYIASLHLAGKDFRTVLGTLLREGFHCSVQDGEGESLPPPNTVPATLDCQKDGTSLSDSCEVLKLAVLPADEHIATAVELLRSLGNAKAGGIVVVCLAKPPVTAKAREVFEQNRAAAEEKLAERVHRVGITGKTGAQVLTELLGLGYECGAEPKQIACTIRSADRQCVQEKTVLELELSEPDRSPTLLEHLDKSVAGPQQNSCQIPF